MIKNKNLEQIINLFKNNQFDEALRFCDQNSDESIGHIILNFRGSIYFKQKNLTLLQIYIVEVINYCNPKFVITFTNYDVFFWKMKM